MQILSKLLTGSLNVNINIVDKKVDICQRAGLKSYINSKGNIMEKAGDLSKQ